MMTQTPREAPIYLLYSVIKEVKEENMEIGNKIKEARNGAELTQDQAAEKIMVSRQTISNWETGVSQTKRY